MDTENIEPELVSKATIGPTALMFLNSDKLGTQYQNTIFMGDVNTGSLYNFKLNQDRTGLSLTGSLSDKITDTRILNRLFLVKDLVLSQT